MKKTTSIVAALAVAGILTGAAEAASHLWRFNEVFSNADGTIQFIEMKECCGAASETQLMNKWIQSAASGEQYVFPENLVCCTADKFLLLATAGFAALPGAPTPDFIIPDGFVEHIANEELTYWFYAGAVMSWSGGALPLDGVDALRIDGSTGPNTPTNFAGESGSVTVPCHPADLDASGAIDFVDLLTLLSSWGPCSGCAADMNSDENVDFVDLLALLAAWGPCP